MLNKQGAADVLKVHINTINKYVDNGMPHYKLGRNIRFDENEIVEWYKNQSKKKGE